MQKEQIKIVPADSKDVRGMQEVFYETWLDTYPNKQFGITREDIEHRFKDSFSEEALAKRAEEIAHPPEGHTLLFAKDKDRVVGVCRIIEHSDKNQLKVIYVLPKYQRKGVGNLLWKEAEKRFDPSKDIVTQVATYNDKAIGFYKKLGFQDTGKRFTEDRFVMKSGAKIPEMELVLKKS